MTRMFPALEAAETVRTRNPRVTPQQRSSAGKLSDEQKEYVVRRLAAQDRPDAVQKGLADLFGVKVSCQSILFYDPTRRQGAKRESRWTALFHATREQLRKGGAKFVARQYANKGKLTDAQKEYVVRRLAALDRPTAVRKGLRDVFGVEMSRQAIQFYDPARRAAGKRKSRWKVLFHKTQLTLREKEASGQTGSNAGRLTEQQQEYVVQRLAAFDRVSEVQKGLRDEFGVEILRRSIQFYDPTSRASRGLHAKWRTLFHATREALRAGSAEIGASHALVRIRWRESLALDAMEAGNAKLANDIFDSIATDVDRQKHANRKAGNGKTADGVPLVATITINGIPESETESQAVEGVP